MKIHIVFEIQNKATGGGNQFLKAVKNYFISIDAYSENISEADIILFNSHQFIDNLIKIKKSYPNKLYIHRIDGPMRLYNSMQDQRDFIVNISNKIIADATIFQSNWSKEQNYLMGIDKKRYETVAINAPDPKVFTTKGSQDLNEGKIKIIATSWSSNWKKGFKVYSWLDQNLDFDKYEMTFVGNTPVEFKNIIHKEAMSSSDLSQELKKNDIYITASQKDPCSNSLLEAIHTGLVALVLNDGGHPEIIKDRGVVFDNKEQIPQLLNLLVKNYSSYASKSSLESINSVGAKYYDFIHGVYKDYKNGNYEPKKFNLFNYINIKTTIFNVKLIDRLNYIKQKTKGL